METIKAPTKLKALKKAGFDKVYWKGSTPFSVIRGIYTEYVYAIKIANGEFFLSIERVK